MIEVTSDWQTVDRSLAELENSWSVFDNGGKQLGNDGKWLGHVPLCWQTVGQNSALLANSLNIIGILMDDNN